MELGRGDMQGRLDGTWQEGYGKFWHVPRGSTGYGPVMIENQGSQQLTQDHSENGH